jgi:hypothetical protein
MVARCDRVVDDDIGADKADFGIGVFGSFLGPRLESW